MRGAVGEASCRVSNIRARMSSLRCILGGVWLVGWLGWVCGGGVEMGVGVGVWSCSWGLRGRMGGWVCKVEGRKGGGQKGGWVGLERGVGMGGCARWKEVRWMGGRRCFWTYCTLILRCYCGLTRFRRWILIGKLQSVICMLCRPELVSSGGVSSPWYVFSMYFGTY